jgi:hypothetical protein
MRAIAVFHDHGGGRLRPFLRPGFRHCFCAVASGPYWIAVDGRKGLPAIEVVAGAEYDLAAFYRGLGYAVAEIEVPALAPRQPVALGTCVGAVKRVVGVRAPFALTPYRLWKHLTRTTRRSDMSSLFSPPSPPIPPPPPPPTVADPSVQQRKEEERQARLRRMGMRAAILTSGLGDTSTAPVSRPTLLGQSGKL